MAHATALFAARRIRRRVLPCLALAVLVASTTTVVLTSDSHLPGMRKNLIMQKQPEVTIIKNANRVMLA